MPIQALILLAILAASALIFTVVFVIVADRELAKPEDANGARDRQNGNAGRAGRGENESRAVSEESTGSTERDDSDARAVGNESAEREGSAERGENDVRDERDGRDENPGSIGREEKGDESGGGRGA